VRDRETVFHDQERTELMRVLCVNQSTGPLFIDIVNAFSDAGHEVVLFAGEIQEGSTPLDRNISVIRGPAYSRKNLTSRLFTWLWFSILYAGYLTCCRKPDLVLVVTNPPLAPLATWLVTSIRRVPYCVLVYDLYPEVLVHSGMLRESSMVNRMWQKTNARMFGAARKVFTLSHSMLEATSPYVNRDKIQIVHNWADSDYIRPVPKGENPFIRLHGLEGKKVVLYSGNMGLTHDLESVIEAASILRHSKNLQFIMIGEGGKRAKLEEAVRARGLTNVLFLPFQDAVNFPYAMAAADVGIIAQGDGIEGCAVPSKTYTTMAARVCLLAITPETSEVSRLVMEYKIGRVCEPGNPALVASTIEELVSDDDLLQSYKNNSRMTSKLFTPANAREYLSALEGQLLDIPC